MIPNATSSQTQGESSSRAIWWLGAVVLVEASMYSVLTPLLPQLSQEMRLDKGQAGILFSMYLLGSLGGTLAGSIIARVVGRRIAIQLALGLFAVTTIALALASTFMLASAFRLLAGFGGGVAWVVTLTWLLELSSIRGRGTTVGTAMSLSIVGTLVGPLIGNAAVLLGRLPVFSCVAVACVVIAFCLPSAPVGRSEPSPSEAGDGRVTVGRRRILVASVWTLSVVAFAYGALFVLLPLRLSGYGIPGLWIGWIFVASSVASALVNRQAGKAADKVGTSTLSLVSLIASAAVLVGLGFESDVRIEVALVVVAMGFVFALGLTPNSTAISYDVENLGLSKSTASIVILVTFAGGEAAGSIFAPTLAQNTSDSLTFFLLAALIIVTVPVLWMAGRRRARLDTTALLLNIETSTA
jgi:predicted MFS family arabinose efflux permease